MLHPNRTEIIEKNRRNHDIEKKILDLQKDTNCATISQRLQSHLVHKVASTLHQS